MLKCRFVNLYRNVMSGTQCLKRFPVKQNIVIIRCKSIHVRPVKAKRDEIDSDFLKWVMLAIPVTTFGLGWWQVQRRKWKLNLIQNLNDKTQAPPVQLPETLSELENMEFQPVIVRGHYLHDKEFTIGPRNKLDPGEHGGTKFFQDMSGNIGFLVITPFKLANRDEVILVNRGWVHNSLKDKSTRPESLITNELEVTGLIRLDEKRGQFMPKNNPARQQWMNRNLIEMSKMYNTAPVWIDLRETENKPRPHGWPLPNQTRIALRNEHMSYIITWFGLCGATSWMWFRLFVQKLPLP